MKYYYDLFKPLFEVQRHDREGRRDPDQKQLLAGVVLVVTPVSEEENKTQDTGVTMTSNGPSDVTSEVRGVASCEGIFSMRTDKCEFFNPKNKNNDLI